MNFSVERSETDCKCNEKRELWSREDDLINHRLTWLGVTQTLIATVLAVIGSQAASDVSPSDLSQDAKAASLILAVVGLATCLAIWWGIKAASDAQKIIDWRYNSEPGISERTTARGRFVAHAIPLILAVGWLLYLVLIGRKYFLGLVCS